QQQKLKYHVLADGVYWNDEGLEDLKPGLSNAFRFVLNHRTNLLAGSESSNELSQHVFDLAKRYYPNWIGFREDRCRFDQQLSARIGRIRAVSEWKIEKHFRESED
ncbi:MAG: hypothetical protein AAGB22_03050, partial [Bacteroidota bacterium]